MRRDRTKAAILALALTVGLVSSCSSNGASKAKTQRQRAAHARVVAAQRAKRAHRRQVARQRAAARRRARVVVARQRAKQARPTRLRRARAANPARDLAAIRRSVRRLNAAFKVGVARGITRSTALNYWVVAGVYNAATCEAFETNAGQGVVAERLVVHPKAFRATPGWVDPTVGRTPRGRLYVVGVDEIQTLVPTGARRRFPHDLHASVDGKGHAHLFFRCA
jgi:hypothetical protein